MKKVDAAVVGAGMGGLAAAAVLAAGGRSVLVCEGSGELGGCAGSFRRSGYLFSAGATYGMGFESGGLFGRLYRELGLPLPPLHPQSVIMDVHLPDRTVRYYRQKEAWFREIRRVFPAKAQNIIDFYEEVFGFSFLLEQVAVHRPVLPPRTSGDAARLLRMADLRLLKRAPLLLQTLGRRLHRYGLEGEEAFVHFLNGQLIDSVQTTVDECPVLLAYTALNVFHRGAYYIDGGLSRIALDLAESVRSSGSEVRLRTPITGLRRSADGTGGWELRTRRGELIHARQVVLGNSLHSFHGLLDGEALLGSSGLPSQEAEENRPAWSAFTLYMGGPADKVFPPADAYDQDGASPVLYHQFIRSYGAPLAETNQFLLSISRPGDDLRAPAGHAAITASTHTAPDPWWSLDRAAYERRKQEYVHSMLEGADRAFPGFSTSLEVVLPGTPVTFERYTQRRRGKVGGYIPQGPLDLLRMSSAYSGLPGVYLCGDTVYPGAGTLGSAMSGWIAAERMLR
ncbi:phytoene desaturase family protein [Paenibacillus sp. S-38]|uniref:phytoene desaturase family protein n=1 Tax=Paenibacillus sp. S-38 TaxID=3416710 RepID=UPI003CF374EB